MALDDVEKILFDSPQFFSFLKATKPLFDHFLIIQKLKE